MVLDEIDKTSKRGLHPKGPGIRMPWRAGFHLQGDRSNAPNVGELTPDLSLKPDRLTMIVLGFKGSAKAKMKIAEHPVLLELAEAVHQGFVRKGIPLMKHPQPFESTLGGKDDR